MTIRRMPLRLSDLPTFTYSRAARNAVTRHYGRKKDPTSKGTLCKATSRYRGGKDYTRCTSENLVDMTRWKGKTRPRTYPTGLRYPVDMLRAVLYSTRGPQEQTKKSKKAASARRTQVAEGKEICFSCDSMADSIDELCDCTATPWDTQKTEDWRTQNIELKWTGDIMGVGTYALQAFSRGFVLGEYVGELVHNEDNNSGYLFDVSYDKHGPLACLDSLRVGNWTRFINHSCDPNAQFADVRVGEEVKYIVKAGKEIKVGDEVTVDYGKKYWATLNEKGTWCACGARVCVYDEEDAWKARADGARTARTARARARKAGKVEREAKTGEQKVTKMAKKTR